jgi:hypothetical protein
MLQQQVWVQYWKFFMPPKYKEFLFRWLNNTAGVAVATYLVRKGIHYQKPVDLVVASLLLGMLYAFVRPLLMLLSLPLLILTLGLFTFVINALREPAARNSRFIAESRRKTRGAAAGR